LPAGFRWGRQQQRVFWRHFPGTGVASLLMLPLMAMCQSLANLPRPSAVTQPLGRLVACLEFWRYRRHHRRMADLQLLSAGATASRLRLTTQNVTSDPDPRPSKLPRAA
jgi:hypothetical protein